MPIVAALSKVVDQKVVLVSWGDGWWNAWDLRTVWNLGCAPLASAARASATSRPTDCYDIDVGASGPSSWHAGSSLINSIVHDTIS